MRLLRRRPRLPEWAHGRQAAGLPFMVVECDRCGTRQIAVGPGPHAPMPPPCFVCRWKGLDVHWERVPLEVARTFVASLPTGAWCTFRQTE